jgi:hypothetical protein
VTIWSILSLLLRLTGFARWADFLYEKHEAKVKAQNVANAPLTDDEEARDLLK